MPMKLHLRNVYLFLFLFIKIALAAENVGLYIGSFDPPTIGHREVLLQAMRSQKLKKAYISVNYNTDKDFNASMDERVEMLNRLFADVSDQIEVLREPLEGRPDFARYLLAKHQGKVLGIFGDDTYDKNYKIFTTNANVHDFDYIKVARPQPKLEALESVYVPVTHDIEIDADGTSSSKARELIAQGKDPVSAKVLSKEVVDFITQKKLYLPVPTNEVKDAENRFTKMYLDFAKSLKDVRPDLDLSSLPPPTFKSTQSLAAQKDKIVRNIANHFKMGLEEQLVFRPQAEKILDITYPTRPLRSSEKAGIYIGSFDGPSAGQNAVIAESLRQLGLGVLYVGVLGKSRKPLQATLAERLQMVKDLTKEFGNRVAVLSIPSLDASPSEFQRLKNEHAKPTVAIFGDNVFTDNHARLKDIAGLTFAVVPRNETGNDTYPQGTQIVKLPKSVSTEPPLNRTGTVSPCPDMMIRVGGSFAVHLPGAP